MHLRRGRLVHPGLALCVLEYNLAAALACLEGEPLARLHEPPEHRLGDGVLAQALHGAPEGARAIGGRVALLDDGAREAGGALEGDLRRVTKRGMLRVSRAEEVSRGVGGGCTRS